MHEKTLITSRQVILVTVSVNIATVVLFIPGDMLTIVNQDAWLAVILGGALALLFAYYPLADLGMRYPGQTIIQLSQNILGKFFGKIMGLAVVYYLFMTLCWTFREFGELMVVMMPETPILAFVIVLASLTAYVVYNGLEVICRCTEFVFPFGLFALILIAASNYSNMSYTNLMPVMESGILPLLKASLSSTDWLSVGSLPFGMLIAFANNPKELKSTALKITGLACGLLTVFSIVNIVIFGPGLIKTQNFTLLEVSRYGEFLAFFQSSEVFIIVMWVTWIFIRSALVSYLALFGLSQLLNLADYRALILPLNILAVAYSIYIYDNFLELSFLFSNAHIYFLLYMVGIPLLLWLMASMRVKLKKA